MKQKAGNKINKRRPHGILRNSKPSSTNVDQWWFRISFRNSGLEKAFFDWTVTSTWTRSLLIATNISFLVGATCAYLLATSSSRRFAVVSIPLFCACGCSVVNLAVHMIAAFIPRWRPGTRLVGYLYFVTLLGLFQWILCIVYQMALAFVSAAAIIWCSAALGYRFAVGRMAAMIWLSSLSFIILSVAEPVHAECEVFPHLSLIFCLIQAVLFSIIYVEQERIFRNEFLRSVQLERALEDQTEENRSLMAEIDKMKTARRNNARKVELDTPLDRVLSKLQKLSRESHNEQSQKDLSYVIKTLTSTVNILQPSMSLVGGGDVLSTEIDQSVSQWLVNEVNVRASSAPHPSRPSTASAIKSAANLSVVVPSSASAGASGSAGSQSAPSSKWLSPDAVASATPDLCSTAPADDPVSPIILLMECKGPAGSGMTDETETALRGALQNVTSWYNCDLQLLSDLTSGRPLYAVTMAMFQEFGLLDAFNLDRERLSNFLSKVESGYCNVPYHNNMHAADVVQAVGFLLKHTGARKYLSQLDIFSCLLAATVHDLGHMGCNNSYEIQTASERALTYNDKSVWENYHLSRTFALLCKDEYNFLKSLAPLDRKDVRKTVIACVLATDLGQHFDHVCLFRGLASSGGDGFSSADGRQCLLNMVMKMADISNAGRPFHIYMQWVGRIMEEFYRQGEMELDNGLPISPFMDRSNPQVSKCQCGFLDFLVLPTYTAWAQIFPESSPILGAAKANRQHWASQELAEKSMQLIEASTPHTSMTPTAVSPRGESRRSSTTNHSASSDPRDPRRRSVSQTIKDSAVAIGSWLSQSKSNMRSHIANGSEKDSVIGGSKSFRGSASARNLRPSVSFSVRSELDNNLSSDEEAYVVDEI